MFTGFVLTRNEKLPESDVIEFTHKNSMKLREKVKKKGRIFLFAIFPLLPIIPHILSYSFAI